MEGKAGDNAVDIYSAAVETDKPRGDGAVNDAYDASDGPDSSADVYSVPMEDKSHGVGAVNEAYDASEDLANLQPSGEYSAAQVRNIDVTDQPALPTFDVANTMQYVERERERERS